MRQMATRLHLEADLPYQAAASEAAADLFNGKVICRTEFVVTIRAARAYCDWSAGVPPLAQHGTAKGWSLVP